MFARGLWGQLSQTTIQITNLHSGDTNLDVAQEKHLTLSEQQKQKHDDKLKHNQILLLLLLMVSPRAINH